ncbi:MGH1-like glycoside hydrolase domain-containing protein [Protaetiibacter intestinalis]|uniref:Mannosylglycerate hydrolase MGH1-like glycoside hydrolase domain-containing protein n=1 Tax=Protaetiibacter intestinalis TaxID=2419774 RepID=A0A387B895_9MICO|nr:hypothetical protein [Protaetiibacter intestinalis]AYF97968.1 hypothetical protein D7I47_06655 [Protaetiibacter intestinalis]
MTAIDDALAALRASDPVEGVPAGPLRAGIADAALGFVALGGPLAARRRQALTELADCIRPLAGAGDPVLVEGGAYPGAWVESTGSISVEVLTRFAPAVARATHLRFAELQRDDGLLPYKVTDAGPGFSQIQMVTPLSRTVWNHYLLTGGTDTGYLRAMYDALAANDAWLARHRDTRGTGGVEAFCTFDTGHDASPRFWGVPDRCYRGDAARVDPAHPELPFVAPDLTANVAAQRRYLARIATELGADAAPWVAAAAASTAALVAQCLADDGRYYDRDARGELRRIASDVILRVYEAEHGDDAEFAAALDRDLLNTRRFLSAAGLTSLAMDDPRFSGDASRNSWGGPVNLLSMIRAAHPFELHGRVAEHARVATATLTALAVADRFPQCLDPFSGAAGYTEAYSPALLFLLDQLERSSGVLPRPDGELWLSGLTPTRLEHGAAADAVGASRRVGGALYELAGDDERIVVERDGSRLAEFPRGWRLVADAAGAPVAVVNLAAAPVSGELVTASGATRLTLAPNERVTLPPLAVSQTAPAVTTPPIFRQTL